MPEYAGVFKVGRSRGLVHRNRREDCRCHRKRHRLRLWRCICFRIFLPMWWRRGTGRAQIFKIPTRRSAATAELMDVAI